MAGPAARAANETFRANVRFFNPITDTRDLYFRTQGEDREIRSTFNGPSGRYLYESESPRLLLYRMSGTGEEAQRTPVATVNLPETGQNYLVFLLPDRRNGTDSYLTRAFNDNTQTLPRGNTCIYNLSAAPIAVKYGESKLLVKEGSSGMVNNHKAKWMGLAGGSGEDTISLDLPVQIAVKNDEKWKTVYRSVWYLNEEARYKIFVIPETQNTVRVVQVVD
ncbi:MAG: hypothetical protein Q7Q73_05660 [Verrucomicrobiota bacterium JB024]|nr:hypothetical protein [Verrucomicrobiota bacterium JB024]